MASGLRDRIQDIAVDVERYLSRKKESRNTPGDLLRESKSLHHHLQVLRVDPIIGLFLVQ